MLSNIKHLFKPQFFIIFISIIAGIYYQEILEYLNDSIKENLWFTGSASDKSSSEISKAAKLKEAKVTQTSQSNILFTKDSLWEFNGQDDGSKNIYLAILGSVYDVTKGRKHYGTGCTYSLFAGRDASAHFISGNFDNYDENTADDVLTLSKSDLLSLFNWKSFYDKEYIFKGKLIGRFYDKNGELTKYHHKVNQMLQLAKDEKDEKEIQKLLYPPCNIEWTQETGTRVWCTAQSGGIDRGWIGVPRKYFEPGQTSYRCACIQEIDLNSPLLKGYDDCEPTDTECFYNLE